MAVIYRCDVFFSAFLLLRHKDVFMLMLQNQNIKKDRLHVNQVRFNVEQQVHFILQKQIPEDVTFPCGELL